MVVVVNNIWVEMLMETTTVSSPPRSVSLECENVGHVHPKRNSAYAIGL
jgi:hypothetical protein